MTSVHVKAEAVIGPRLEKYGRALGLEGLRRLLQKTPVDTGHARGNWFVGDGEPVRAQVEGRTAGTAATEGQGVIGGFDIRVNDLHLTNTVPYIERLEDGWSGQAPQGMAKQTVAELKRVSDQIAASLNR